MLIKRLEQNAIDRSPISVQEQFGLRSIHRQERKRLDAMVRRCAAVGETDSEWWHCFYWVCALRSETGHDGADDLDRYEKTIELLDTLDPEKKYI